MDQINTDVTELYREHARDSAHHLGLFTVVPINVDTYPHSEFDVLWQRVSTADYAFEDTVRGDKQWFIKSMLEQGTFNFEIPNVAFIQLSRAGPGSNAHLHLVTYGNGPAGPLFTAARELFVFAFDTIKVHRLNAWIPSFNYKALRVAGILRMKFEGQMRRAFLYQEQWWDIVMYGLVEDEWRHSNGGRQHHNDEESSIPC
jgi:RimJ/RimL family protein N-acetyltransferase